MIGERIKQLRQKKGYSITELAKLADVSKSYLSQIERGLQTNPSLQFLNKISIPLETTIEYFLEDQTLKRELYVELDEEWKSLIQQAIKEGLDKNDFREYVNYLRFQEWMKKYK